MIRRGGTSQQQAVAAVEDDDVNITASTPSPRICKHCGSEFQPSEDGRALRSRFCSRRCRIDSHNRRRYRPPGGLLCGDCKQPLPDDAHGNTRYCASCAGLRMRSHVRRSYHAREERPPTYSQPREERTCEGCESVSELMAPGQKYCAACAAERQRERVRRSIHA